MLPVRSSPTWCSDDALAHGQPLGAAVAGARRELRRRGAPPRAWAVYSVTGNPAGRVRVTGRADSTIVTARVAGGLALVLLGAAAAMRLGADSRPRRAGRPPPSRAPPLRSCLGRSSPGPRGAVKWDAGLPADRGGIRVSFAPAVADGRVRWSPVTGADDYVAEMFDEAGLPIGSPASATSPFIVPWAAARDGSGSKPGTRGSRSSAPR